MRTYTGAIILKELRAMSRQQFYYWLRFGYIILLLSMIVTTWIVFMHYKPSSSVVLTVAGMGTISSSIVLKIMEFQFLITQLLAIVFLSDSMSAEKRKCSLEILLSTKISAFEIVLGKLIAGLLPVITLLLISVPLLGIIRLWGGVQWDFVIVKTVITLCAVVLIGMLTLLGSMFVQHSHRLMVIMSIFLVIVYFVSYMVLPILKVFSIGVRNIMIWSNPYLMYAHINTLFNTKSSYDPVLLQNNCIYHVLVILFFTFILLCISALLVRRCAVNGFKMKFALLKHRNTSRQLRRVRGSCILWLNLRGPVWRTLAGYTGIYLVFGIAMLVMGLTCIENGPVGPVFMAWSGGIRGFWIICTVLTVASAAISIGQYKDTRTWPLLLSTVIPRGRIIRDLALAALIRHIGAWLILVLNSVLQWWIIYAQNDLRTSFDTYFNLCILFASVPVYIVFLIGTGMFLAVHSKTGTMAVLLSLAFVVCHFMLTERIFWDLASIIFSYRNHTTRIVLQITMQAFNLTLGITGLILARRSLQSKCIS